MSIEELRSLANQTASQIDKLLEKKGKNEVEVETLKALYKAEDALWKLIAHTPPTGKGKKNDEI